MNLQINCTQDGIKEYPMHMHNNYEIMLYLSGNGNLRTLDNNYPFSPGTIIIVPPGTEHGSASEYGFKNISVAGEFEQMLHFKNPVTLTDNAENEGTLLATMIYNNRFGNSDYLSRLCSAYIHFLLQHLKFEDNIGLAVNKIICKIMDSFHDEKLDLSVLLNRNGYAEDYIRAYFKKITGKTPITFLTDIRIKHALFLIEIYMNTLSLQQVAERCGYTDYVYFSKKFKKTDGHVSSEIQKYDFESVVLKICFLAEGRGGLTVSGFECT